LLGAAAASASLIPVDFSAFHNARPQGGKGSAEYPEGNLVLGGVLFDIPVGGNNYWSAIYSDPNPHRIDVPVGIFGVAKVFALINTAWGQDWTHGSFAAVEFYGSGGAFYRKDLYGSQDIRDWLWGYRTNSINGTTTTNVFKSSGGFNYQARLDMQRIEPPSAFLSQTLDTISFIDNGGSNFQRLRVSGITAET